jgi:hypothetical protein
MSISEYEKNKIMVGDTLKIKVVNEDGKVIGGAIYSGAQFHRSLEPMKTYYLLPYAKSQQ